MRVQASQRGLRSVRLQATWLNPELEELTWTKWSLEVPSSPQLSHDSATQKDNDTFRSVTKECEAQAGVISNSSFCLKAHHITKAPHGAGEREEQRGFHTQYIAR